MVPVTRCRCRAVRAYNVEDLHGPAITDLQMASCPWSPDGDGLLPSTNQCIVLLPSPPWYHKQPWRKPFHVLRKSLFPTSQEHQICTHLRQITSCYMFSYWRWILLSLWTKGHLFVISLMATGLELRHIWAYFHIPHKCYKETLFINLS